MGTVIVSLLLILIVVGAVRTIIRDKKEGKSCCGGSCSSCKMCASRNVTDHKK